MGLAMGGIYSCMYMYIYYGIINSVTITVVRDVFDNVRTADLDDKGHEFGFRNHDCGYHLFSNGHFSA